MSSPTELAVNRKNTAAFIAVQPTTIVLAPQRRVRTTTGGFDTASDPPRASQTMRIIDTTNRFIPNLPPQRTIDGVERSVEFMLLAKWDASLAVYDTWKDSNGRYEITSMFPDNGYERRAVVVRYAD